MKKLISLLLVLLMTLSLVACGGGSSSGSSGSSGDAASSDTADTGSSGDSGEAAPAGEKVTWIYANVGAAEIVANVHMEEMAKVIAEKTNGNFVIECYHNSAMGGNREIVEGMQFGTIQMTLSNISTLSGYSKNIAVVEAPYLFENLDGAYNVFVESDVLKPIYDDMEAIGLKWLTGWYQGYRVLTTSDKAVHTPADMKGLKIRTMESETHMAHFNALGSNAIPMAFSEVFTALQQGALDGQENPYVQIFTQGINEVQKYIVETNHICDVMPFLVSKKAYDELPEEYRKVLDETVAEYTRKVWDATEVDIERIKGEINASGKTEIIQLTPEEYQQFRDAAAPVYELIEGMVGTELMDAVVAAAG